MNGDIRICFVGDSFVNGTGDETALGWTGRLCAAANAGGHRVTYYNLGVRRHTSGDILQRWKSECDIRLPDGCDGRIVLSCGVNDTMLENGATRIRADESHTNVREILLGARRYRTLFVGPPPVDDTHQNGRIRELSRAFAEEAAALGVPYIDLFAPLAADEMYRRDVSNNDGSHPRSGGYAIMARIVGSSPNWWFHAP